MASPGRPSESRRPAPRARAHSRTLASAWLDRQRGGAATEWSSTLDTLDIAIVGYGTAGQACAALLARDGHRVEVFERAAQLGPVGAGLLLQPSGLSVLWELGLLDGTLTHGRRVDRLYGDDHDGRLVMDMHYHDLDPRLFGVGIQRGALFALLDTARHPGTPVHRDAAIVEIDVEAGRLRDGHGRRHGPFDLVVIADGAASRLRTHIGKPQLDRPYPWGALWCLCPADGWAEGGMLRQRYRLARRMIGMLPVGTRPDDPGEKLSFFWSLPSADFERWAAAGLDAWREELRQLWPEADAQLGPIDDPGRLARAQYRDAVLARWFRGRAVLAGDAAHAMSPQLGQGVNMALLDAQALRDALRARDTLDAALSLYQQRRQAHVGIYHQWSRWLTPLFQSRADSIAWLRNRLFDPLGRIPPGSGLRLRVLSGLQQGWLSRLGLAEGFFDALSAAAGAARSEHAV